MITPDPTAFEEERRLKALSATGLLDTLAEQEFNVIADLAATVISCPIALVSLIDKERQWFKARHGLDVAQTPRELSFCAHLMRRGDILVVPDATRDPRFADNALVTGEPHIRFYAGAPIEITAPDGGTARLGALCVIDRAPRTLSDEEAEALKGLARIVSALAEARSRASDAIGDALAMQLQTRLLWRQDRMFRQAERIAMMGSWHVMISDESMSWSDNIYRIYGLPIGKTPAMSAALEFYPPYARAEVADALARTMATGEPMDVEVDFLTAQGAFRRVRALAELEVENGVPTAVIGVMMDVTERHELEQNLRRVAEHDPLTGIANRTLFNRMLERGMAAASIARTPIALILIDLDGFKRINDRHGHLVGDEVLCEVARRLGATAFATSFAARLGGDEFALIVSDPEVTGDLEGLTNALLTALKAPVTTAVGEIGVSGTLGVSVLQPDTSTMRDFFHQADTALYEAKRSQRGTVRFFAQRDERRGKHAA